MTIQEHKEKLHTQLQDLSQKIQQGEVALTYMRQQACRIEGAIAILDALAQEGEETRGSLGVVNGIGPDPDIGN